MGQYNPQIDVESIQASGHIFVCKSVCIFLTKNAIDALRAATHVANQSVKSIADARKREAGLDYQGLLYWWR